MSTSLLKLLIQTTLTPPNTDQINTIRQQLSSATEIEWSSSISELYLHRLAPLIFYTLNKYHLTDVVPQSKLTALKAVYHQTLKQNQLHLKTLGRLLKAMQVRQLHPVIWKGIALADSFYPDIGTRPMSDLDFAVLPPEKEQVSAVFQALGFIEQPSMETPDAVYFTDPMGVVCDVHHRVRLFEGKESMNLTLEIQPQYLKVPTFTVLEPNAMLVHLIVHLDGHRKETGPILSWILDIAFVISKWGNLIEIEKLEKLMPTQDHFISLFRIIRFLETEFFLNLPDCLTHQAKTVEPLTLAEIFRQRRLALWRLPQLQGWLRVGANQLGIRLKYPRPPLKISDLLFFPLDWFNYQKIRAKLFLAFVAKSFKRPIHGV